MFLLQSAIKIVYIYGCIAFILALTCDFETMTKCIVDFEIYVKNKGYNASYIDQSGDTDDEIRQKYSDYCR